MGFHGLIINIYIYAYGKIKVQRHYRKNHWVSFEVHGFLGNGFQEVIYQKSLAYELWAKGLNYQREIEMDIFYKDLQSIGTRRADFIVEDKIVVEIKAVIELQDVHMADPNYLKAYRMEVRTVDQFWTSP